MTEPTLGVVIATFDRYAVLADTVADLLRQTEPPDEIVVVDSTPPERCGRPVWIDDVGTRKVRYVVSPGVGANRARNVGLRVIDSEYVLLLDDDMRLSVDCLATFRAAHLQGWEAVHGQLEQRGEQLFSRHGGDRPFWNVVRHRHGALRCHTMAVSSSFISVKLARLREIGLLDEEFLYSYDDYDLGYRLWKAGCITVHEPSIRALHLQAPAGGGRHPAVRVALGRNPYRDKYRFLLKHFNRRALRVELVSDVLLLLAELRYRPVQFLREARAVAAAYRATMASASRHSPSPNKQLLAAVEDGEQV